MAVLLLPVAGDSVAGPLAGVPGGSALAGEVAKPMARAASAAAPPMIRVSLELMEEGVLSKVFGVVRELSWVIELPVTADR
jgi:hypothetical protein